MDLIAMLTDREGSLHYSWQLAKSDTSEEDSMKTMYYVRGLGLIIDFHSSDHIVNVVKKLNWKCWRQLATNPKFDKIEHAGYILKYKDRYLNPVIYRGDESSVNMEACSECICTIHTHNRINIFEAALPSGADYKAAVNKGLQLIVSKFGIVVYFIYGDWTDEYFRILNHKPIEFVNQFQPYMGLHLIEWSQIKRK